jgi:hypothetical protein
VRHSLTAHGFYSRTLWTPDSMAPSACAVICAGLFARLFQGATLAVAASQGCAGCHALPARSVLDAPLSTTGRRPLCGTGGVGRAGGPQRRARSLRAFGPSRARISRSGVVGRDLEGARPGAADLPAEKTDELRRLAVACYRAVECEGMGPRRFPAGVRHRQTLHQRDRHHPGFTSIGMYPKMWEHSGIAFAELIDRLIELALDRHKRKKATKFAP